MKNFSSNLFNVTPATSNVMATNAIRSGFWGKCCGVVCALLLLSLATTRSYAAGATYTGTLGGAVLTASNACQGAANVLVYSYQIAQSSSTNDIEGFKFTTTAGAMTTVGSYNVYIAPSSAGTLSAVPTNAFLLGSVANGGVGTQMIATWYSTDGGTTNVYYPITTGTTYYIYITANILATASVGATIQVTAPTGGTAGTTNEDFSWAHTETGAGTAPAASVFSVSACPCTSYFSYTGGPTTAGGVVQTYTVPTGCTNLDVTVAGARGGDGEWETGRSIGGNGGIVTSTLNVTPATLLNVYVGGVGYSSVESGTAYPPGGSNSGGGATGGTGSYHQGGGGGGASDIRGTAGLTTAALSSRVITGGAGGGGCYNTTASQGGGGGYNSGTGGADGEYDGAYNASQEGGPGRLTAGGIAPTVGTAGEAGFFGAGGSATGDDGAAGGGAGYYGAAGTNNAGGCGGSSYAVTVAGVATVSATTYTDGNTGVGTPTYTGNWGSGYVQITPVFTVTGTTVICAGSTATVNLSGSVVGATYNLYAGATFVSSVTGTGSALTFTVAPIVTTTYTINATTPLVNMAGSAIITAGINGNTGPICIGSTLALTAPPGAGVWSSSSPTVGSVSTIGIVTGLSAGTTTIMFVATGCTSTTIVTVSATAGPAPITGNTGAVCIGSSLSLSDATGAGTWSSSAVSVGNISPTSTGSGAATTFTGAYGGTTNVIFTLTSTGCAATTIVTVNALAVISGNTGPVCTSGILSLSDSTGTGTWLSGSTGIATVDGGGNVTGVASGTTIITFTLTSTGCSITTVVTVNAPPSSLAPTVTPNPACVGNAITLSGNVTGGTALSYAWTGPIGGITTPTAVNAGITAVVAGDAGSYTLTVTALGCAAVIGTSPVLTVNQLPTVLTALASPNPVVQGSSVSLTATATGGTGVTYAWTGPTTGDIVNPTSITTASITAASAGDAGVYTITASAAGCGSATATTVLGVLTPASPGSGVCAGTANLLVYSFAMTQAGATNYIEDFGFATTAGDATTVGSYYVYIAPSSAGTLSVVPTNAYLLGSVLNGGVGTQTLPNWYSYEGTADNNYFPITSGNTYYVYITANILATASVGATVAVNNASAASFTWKNTEASAGVIQAGSTYSVIACPCTSYYSYTGGPTTAGGAVQNYTVPTGCTNLNVTVAGSRGGDGQSSTNRSIGGNGGTASSTLSVTSGTTLQVYVGNVGYSSIYTNSTTTNGPGGSNSGGGANGGAAGVVEGGGGGGSSDIRGSAGTLATRVATGGAGGGGTCNGTDPGLQNFNGGAGGYSVVGAELGGGRGVYNFVWSVANDGDPGSTTAGGAKATAGGGSEPGGLGYGGYGVTGYGSAGGGAGYYGAAGSALGGACGGSSLDTTITGVATVSATTYTDGNNTGAGYVQITPIFTVSGTASICAIGSTATALITLSGSVSGATYGLYNGATLVTSLAGTGAALTFTVTPGVSTVTTYTVNATTPSVNMAGSATITVLAAPADINGNTGGPICTSSILSLSDVTGAGTWASSNVGVGSIATSTIGNVTGASAGTTNITFTLSSSGCTVSTVVTVNAPPSTVAPTVLPNPICAGSSITLTGGVTGGTSLSYAWTGPTTADIADVSSVNTGITTVGTGDAGSYTLVVTATGCAAVIGTTSGLVVGELPSPFTASVSPNPAGACVAVSLTGSTTGANNATYAWTGPITTDISNPTSATVAGLTSAGAGDAGIYTISATAPGCGSETATTTALTVNGAPALAGLSSSTTICYNGSSSQVANYSYGAAINGAVNYILSWSPAGPTNITSYTSIPGPIGVNVPAATLAGVYTGTLTVENSGGCSSNYILTLTINELPTTFSASVNPNPICSNYPITLTGTSAGSFGVSYAWTGSTTGDITSADSLSTGIVSTEAGDAGVYTLTASAAVCGSSQVLTGSLTVNPTPAVITGASSVVCASASLGDATSGGTWSSVSTGIATIGTDGTVMGVSPGTTTISYLIGSCAAMTIVTVGGAPPAILGTADIIGLPGNSTLSDVITGGTWSSSNTGVATVDPITGVVTGVAGGTTYITYATTCGSTSVLFNVDGNPACSATSGAWANSWGTGSITFNYTGAVQTYTVIPGITGVACTVRGAAGGGTGGYDTYGNPGGLGGYVAMGEPGMVVTGGHILSLFVGGTPAYGAPTSAFPGGGTAAHYGGGFPSAGGGGYSAIRDSTKYSATITYANILVVAGGGGGGGGDYYPYDAGGAGGGYVGGSSQNGETGGTTTGTGTGTGGTGNVNGGFLTGGNSKATTYYYGGGGGGGYYGGGGGGQEFGADGGGGGSSYINGTYTVMGTAITNTQGYASATGNGVITIGYTVPTLVSCGISTFSVTAATGANLSTTGITGSASASTGYLNDISLSPITFYTGGVANTTYAGSLTWGVDADYQAAQVWIDFNDDGVFQASEQVTPVVGWSNSLTPTPTPFTVTIPDLSTPGNHLMRVRGIIEYDGVALGTSAPGDLDPCLNEYLGAAPEYNGGDEVDYTVNIKCNTPAITGSTFAICASGGTTTLADGVSGGAWTSSSPGIATVVSGTVTGVTAGTATITYTIANSCSVTQTVTVDALPVVSISPSSVTRCAADAGNTLTASGASSYTWSPATFLSATTGASVTETATVTTTYTVSGTIGVCSDISTILVSVNPNPTIGGFVSTPANGVCYNASSISSISYTYSTTNSPDGYALAWPVGSGLPNVSAYSSLSGSIGVTIPAGEPAAAYTGTVTVDNSTTGCTSVATMILSIDPLPVPSFTDSAGTSACTGVTVAYVTQPGAGQYVWGISGALGTDYNIMNVAGSYIASDGLVYTFSGDGDGDTLLLQWLTPGAQTVTINYATSVGSCTAVMPTSNTVNIVPSPTATAANSSPLCATGTVTLTATSTTATNYSWTGSDGFSSTLQDPEETLAGTGTVTYSLTVSNAGCSPTFVYTTVATVIAQPTAAPTNGGPICDGGTVSLTANSNASTTIWSWVGSDGSSSGLEYPVASPTSTATYSLTVSTTGSGCQPGNVYTTTVTVNPIPTSTSAGNTGPICAGGTVTLSANSSNATTWSWTGSDGSTSTDQNPVMSPTATTTYSLTMTGGTASGCNPGTIYATTVIVNPTPLSSGATNGGPICNGGTVGLFANSSNTLLWSWNGSDGSSSGLENPVMSPTTTTTYSLTVSYSTASGCQPTTVYTTVVSINPTPSAAPTNSSPICVGGTVSLTANSNSSTTMWSWIGSDGSSSTMENPVASPTTTTTYSVTVSSALSGCQPIAPFVTIVSVNPMPTSTDPANSGTICAGGSVTLSANSSNAITWLWSGSDGSTSTEQNPVMTPTVTTTYSLTLTNGTASGCSPGIVYTTIASVNPTPIAAPTNNGPICLTGTVTLMANPNSDVTGYSWVGSDLTTSTLQNPMFTPTATTTYSLTVSSVDGNSGCTPAAIYTTTVTVNLYSSASPGQSGPICTGGTVALLANPAGETAIGFSWTGPDLTSTTAENTTATPPSGTSVYTLIVTGAPGCGNDTTTIPVIVNGQPTVSALTSTASNPFCGGGSMTLSVTSGGGGGTPTYTWSGPGIATTNSVADDTVFTTSDGVAMGAYSVTLAYSGSGCMSATTASAATYTLTGQPTITGLSSSASNPFCISGSMVFTVSGSSGGAGNPTYTWSGPDIATTTAATNVSPSITTTGGAVTGAYSVTLGYDGTGCNTTSPQTTATYTITAQPSISGLATSASNPFCSGAMLTFTVSGSAGGAGNPTYTWSGPDIATTTAATNVSPSITTAGGPATGAYSVTLGYDGTGCTTTPAVITGSVYTVTAQPAVTGLASSASNPFCSGASMTFTVSSSSGGAGNPTYTWSGPDIATTTASTNVSPLITTSGGAAIGAYSVTLDYDGTGCTASSPAVTAVYTVDVQPTISLLVSSATNPFCAGATMTLTATSTGGAGNPTFTWSGPDITTTASVATDTSFTTSGASTSGEYSVTLSYDGSGCNLAGPVTSDVYTSNAQPSISGLTASPTNPFCVEAVLTFTVTGSAGGAGNPTYTWSGPDIATTTGSLAISPSIATSGGAATGAYSVTLGYDGTGCTTTSPVTTDIYTVTAQPVVTGLTSSASNPFCVGGTMTLTATSGGGAGTPVYSWSGPGIPNTMSLSADTSFTTSGSATTGDYSVTATYSGTGCTSSPFTTGAYTLNAQPAITSITAFTAGGANPLCAETDLMLTAVTNGEAGAAIYTWSGPGITSPVSGSSDTANFNPGPGTGSYSLTLSYNDTGCISASLATVEVYTLLPAPNTATVTPTGPGNTFCGSEVISANNGADGSTMYFEGTDATGTNTLTPGYTATVTATGTYYFNARNAAGCWGIPGSVTVTINPVPSANPINTGYICIGGTVTLEAVPGANASVYAWTDGGSFSSTSENPMATPTITTTYSLTVTDGSGDAGCNTGIVYTTTVSVNPIPMAAAGNTGYICNGGTVTLNETGVSGGVVDYIWSGADIIGSNTGATVNANPSTGISTYTLTVDDGSGNSGCSSQSTTAVTINATPMATAGNTGYICNGGTVTLNETGVSGGVVDYIWSGADIIGSNTGATVTADPSTGISTYTLTVDDGLGSSGCSSQSTTTVTINATPQATATNGGYICNGGTVTLSETGILGSIVNYTWNGADIIGGSVGASVTADPATGISTYTLTVDDGSGYSGCSSQSTTTVTVNPAPSAAPSNNGYICIGGTVTLEANGQNGAATYLWSGPGIAGSTGATVMTAPTSLAVYSVMVTDGSSQSGCSPSTQFTTTVNVNPTPVVSATLNTGYICNGGTVSLFAEPTLGTNVNAYTWNGPSLIATTGIVTTAAPSVTSIYTLTVSDGSGRPGCSPSTEYYDTVIVHATPSASPTNSGPICVGGTVNLTANGTYNATAYSWTGGTVSSSTIADPTATPTDTTIYTLVVSDNGPQSGCSPATQYYDTVIVKGAPVVAASNSGPVCANSPLTLSTSGELNVTNYSWSGPVAITNSTSATASVLTPTVTATGVYTVTVMDSIGSGCSATFTTAATVNPLPVVYTVTGGGAYCAYASDSGVHIGLSGSDTGISYTLYNGSGIVGSSNGTGSALDFGLVTVSGTYTVAASNNITSCTMNMDSSATIIINGLPNQYHVLSTGTNYCSGGIGIDVSLDSSNAGIKYQLYLGSMPVTGYDSVGDNDSISFGFHTIAGDYMVIATDSATGCTNTMLGAAEVIVDSLPDVYSVSGGGAYCAGGSGVAITLSGSQAGMVYSLMDTSTSGSTPMTGTGLAISYDNVMDTGTYVIQATNGSTACTAYMSGSATVSINPVPAIDTVTGSGAYCQGTTGISVGLNSSASGINYRLYSGTALADTLAGSGSSLNFGPQSAGTYIVLAADATTGCTSAMADSAGVIMNPAPMVYNITGIGSYCAGMGGVAIGLSGSDTGVSYTLYDLTTPVATMAGTGTPPLSFGVDTSGTYMVVATYTVTSCTDTMSGGGAVIMNALPNTYGVTGGGSYCAGSGGVAVGVSSADAGVKYFLYNGASVVDSVLSGTTGTALSFGSQTVAGTYTVNAVNVTTTCSSNMADSAVVVVTNTVTPSVSIATGVGTTVCLGSPVTFTATPVNGGSSPVYEWYVNATHEVVTTSSYSYLPANGDIVKALLISSAACALPDSVSAADTMTVDSVLTPAVSITVAPGTEVCAGTVVTFSATPANGGSLPIFSWKVNAGASVAGQVYTYTPANGDNVSVQLTSDLACASVDTASAYVVMNVGANTAPVVTIVGNPGSLISSGQVDTLSAIVTDANPATLSYQWVVNSSVIAGATTSVYDSAFTANDSVTCQVTTNNGCDLTGYGYINISVAPAGITPVSFGAGDIRLVPNPNQGTFSVKGTLGNTADEEVTMEITDILGQVIYQNKVPVHNGVIDENIQLSNALANGMYMMNLRSGSDSKVIHFVIEQ